MFKKMMALFVLLGTLAISLAACSGTASMTPAVQADAADSSTAVDSEAEDVYLPTVIVDTGSEKEDPAYTLVDTGQGACYDDSGDAITCPVEGEAFYGQDAQYSSAAFDYTDNGDGTITDNVTDLIWQQTPDSSKVSWDDAQSYCESLSLAGSDDWRTPSLKELFSISDFESGWPYINTDYFDLVTASGQDKQEQYWSSNYYEVGTTHGGAPSAIGVNHATGHIKAYPDGSDGSPMAGKYVRCVQGDDYLVNDFVDNGDGTITDNATGLMWLQDDSGEGLDWENALAYAVGADGEDMHGAGAVRFDTKVEGGPTGEDPERVYNYVRLVRGGDATGMPAGG